MTTYSDYKEKNGLVKKGNKEIALAQQAYVVGDGTQYEAMGIDRMGNHYLVTWNTTDDWDSMACEDQEDESHACAWDYPVSVKRI